MFPFFAATGLFLFYCACIPIKFALVVHFNGHTTFGAGLALFEGCYAMKAASLRAVGQKKHWPWKKAGLDLEKRGVIAAAYHASKHLLRHTRLEQLRLEGTLSMQDAAHTALLCGSLRILEGMLLPFAPAGCLQISPQPDFSCRGSSAILRGMISIPAGHIMLAALKGAWHYLHAARRNPSHGKASD